MRSDSYDPSAIRDFYDSYGEREWERFEPEAGMRSRINYLVHLHYLKEYGAIPGKSLDIGSGPGRFALELARMGHKLTIGDISPVQLRMNEKNFSRDGLEGAVEYRGEMDVTDLSGIPCDTFDLVLCYGGPISFVFEAGAQALSELVRVAKPGGRILISVMSLIGSTRSFARGILDVAKSHGIPAVDGVNATGDLRGQVPSSQFCHMYRWSELQEMIRSVGGAGIIDATASNCLTAGDSGSFSDIGEGSEIFGAILRWELDFGREPGSLDGGSHIIAVLEKTR